MRDILRCMDLTLNEQANLCEACLCTTTIWGSLDSNIQHCGHKKPLHKGLQPEPFPWPRHARIFPRAPNLIKIYEPTSPVKRLSLPSFSESTYAVIVQSPRLKYIARPIPSLLEDLQTYPRRDYERMHERAPGESEFHRAWDFIWLIYARPRSVIHEELICHGTDGA